MQGSKGAEIGDEKKVKRKITKRRGEVEVEITGVGRKASTIKCGTIKRTPRRNETL